jgi:hypothetical protein
VVRLDRTIQSKGKASTPKWHATYIKRIRPSSWCPVTAGILRLGGAPFDKASSTAALIYRRSSVSCSPIGRVSTSFFESGQGGGSRRSHQSLELERLQQSRPLVAFPSSTAIKGMMAAGDLPAPKADRRSRPARPVPQAVTAASASFVQHCGTICAQVGLNRRQRLRPL